MTAPRPLYLDLAPGPVFAVYHDRGPAGASSDPAAPGRSGVVIVPPFGWHDVASYRVRRTWAEALASGGHPTLRIDLPGSGDSAGGPDDPGRVAAWTGAVAGAAAWLRATSGVDRVAVIGLGLGGLVAAAAVDAGAPIDDLVLWATPPTGRQLVRQERAFAGTQGDRYSLTGEPEPRLLPDGWLEVNGFVLSAETIADLERLDLRTIGLGSLRRVLLLETDGLPSDRGLAERYAAGGIATATRPGPGWAAMTVHPERAATPTEVLTTVSGWLAEPSPSSAAAGIDADTTAHLAPAAHEAATIQVDGALVRESPVWVPSDAGTLFGLLAEPVDAAVRQPVAAVFLNAGAVRRIGPDRIWVETARRWAAQGVAVLRVDLEGIGDSDGDGERYRDVNEFYVNPALADEIRAFTDTLLARGAGPRVVLAGLCAGGYWAFQMADRDERVTAAFMVNPATLLYHADLVRQRNARRLRRLGEPAWWGRLIRGQVRWSRIRTIARAAVTRPAADLPPYALDPIPMMERLRARRVALLLAFSGDEPLEAELRDGPWATDPDAWPDLVRIDIPGRDHTLRPIVAQRAASRALDEALARELHRASADAGPAEPVATTAGVR